MINNLENYLDGEHKFPEELCNYESLLRLLGDRDVNSFTLITSTREPSIQGVEISQYELRGLEIDEWRKYFSGCENAENSEVLIEMHNAYGGNAEAMRILRFTITSRFNKNIEDYWQLHRNTLLANHSLRNLISIEISWLEANNSDAYKLFCRMGFYRYQDIQTVKFKGLICLLWELPEAKRVEVVDYLSRTSLVNVFQGKYYLHPSVQEAARLCLPSDTEIYRKVHQNIAQYWKSTISGESFFGNYINIFEAFYHYYTAENYQEAFQVFSEKINTDIYEKERYAYLRYWGYSQNVASCLEQLQDNIADEHKAQLTGTIGVCYYYNNSFKKAIDFLEKAEKLISSGQDYRTIRLHSTCHSYLARANRHLGYLSKAVENCELALSHLSKIDPSKETELNKEKFYKVRINSRILRSYASVHYDLGDYQKSLERSEQALECSRNMQEDNPLEHEIGDSLAYKALALFR
ncbi:hypothetical protein [Pseudanabaena minima]|uniref:hypothetical protein n=1 Tax=Pseudanabaena minima TaxID=890415 RepID=UPI003DA98D89